MDYNEKLRLAKEALASESYDKETIEHIFPELKESDDERIRKELLDFCKNRTKKYPNDPKYKNISAWIAWIEKQGKSIDILDVLDDAILDDNKDGIINDTIQSKSKFKVGDWVVFKNRHQSIYQVEKIENGYYILRHTHGGTFRVCILHDEDLRLWSFIVDAKDGDILIDKSGSREGLFIFKETKPSNMKTKVLNPLTVLGYCGIGGAGFTKGSGWGDTANCTYYPATKEQRDTLMKTMADARYTFDFNKKELWKIEQNSVDMVEHNIPHLTDFENAIKDMMNDYRDAIGDNDATIEEIKELATYLLSLIHQRPAWSEEDKYNHNIILYLLNNECVGVEDERIAIEWFKSLKERYTWKPSDEQMKALADALSLAKNCGEEIAFDLRTLLEQLKAL